MCGGPESRWQLDSKTEMSHHCLCKLRHLVNQNVITNQIFHYTPWITPKRVTSLRGRLRVIALGLRSFFRRNVAAVASRWQHCDRFERPEF